MLAILEYRNAEEAVATFNQKDRAAAARRLQENPGLAEVLARMARAQQGAATSADEDTLRAEGAAVFEEYRLPAEDSGDVGSDEGGA